MSAEAAVTSRGAAVLICTERRDIAGAVELPSASSNLFQRLIRNPRAESPLAKERECAEMLCTLLQNAPTARVAVLRWMASEAGLASPPWDELVLNVDTEQSIGSKRDDLRITGWDADSRQRVLWTVEVKVGAAFHRSSRLEEDEEEKVSEVSAAVSQITNYDSWLYGQAADLRAGFVVALHDMRESLPEGLRCRWTCLTWTRLGEKLAEILAGGQLPEIESFLGRHILGFTRDNLWRSSEMSETRLDFNDVALIRAFALLAKECEEKVNRLVAPLADVLRESEVGSGAVGHTKSLFKGMKFSVVIRDLTKDAAIFAGIGGYELGDYLSVWIESPSKHAHRQSLKQALAELEPALQQRNPAWKVMPMEGSAGWHPSLDVELTVSLARVLAAEDQAHEVREFARRALLDLRECGVLDTYIRTMGPKARKRHS